jgi:hypothetical protein
MFMFSLVAGLGVTLTSSEMEYELFFYFFFLGRWRVLFSIPRSASKAEHDNDTKTRVKNGLVYSSWVLRA